MTDFPPEPHSPAATPGARPDILCIGAMLWDVIGRSHRAMQHGQDVPGQIRHIPGGVALNVALACARWGMHPAVLSAVGRDPEGEALIRTTAAQGVDGRWLARDTGLPTDCYMAVEDSNGLVAAIADAHSLERAGAAVLSPLRDGALASAAEPWTGIAVIDGNLTTEQLSRIAAEPGLANSDLRIVPASPGKAERLAPLITAPGACFYLNRLEAEILAGRSLSNAPDAAQAMLDLGMRRVLITDGGACVAEARHGDDDQPQILTETPPQVTIARVTGAGDSFLAAHLAHERAGDSAQAALSAATRAAAAHVSGKEIP